MRDDKAGFIEFAISLKLDVAELAGWEPERVQGLFDGIARVVAATGKRPGKLNVVMPEANQR